MEKTEFMGAQHGPRLAAQGAAGRGEGEGGQERRAMVTVLGMGMVGKHLAGLCWKEGNWGLSGKAGQGLRAASSGSGRFCADTLRNV